MGAERPLYLSINPLPLNPFFLCVSVVSQTPPPHTQSCLFLSTVGGGCRVAGQCGHQPIRKRSSPTEIHTMPLNQGASWQTKYFQQTNVVKALELVCGSQLNIPPASQILILQLITCYTQVDKIYKLLFESLCSFRMTDYPFIHSRAHTHTLLYTKPSFII